MSLSKNENVYVIALVIILTAWIIFSLAFCNDLLVASSCQLTSNGLVITQPSRGEHADGQWVLIGT